MNSEWHEKRILLIDGEASWLEFASAALTSTGYRVSDTSSVQKGWSWARNEEFDLVLVDSKNAEQEEASLRKLTRLQTERGHRLLVLFPTGLTPDKTKVMLLAGVHDCVDKPYEQIELGALVNRQFPEIRATALVVDDDTDWQRRLVSYLPSSICECEVAGDLPTALSILEGTNFDVIVLDLRLVDEGEDFEGMALLKKLQIKSNDVPVIVVSAYGTVEHVKDGFRIYEIDNYLSKQHFDPAEYRKAVERAIRQRRFKV